MIRTSVFRACVFVSACAWASSLTAQDARVAAATAEPAARAEASDDVAVAKGSLLGRTFSWAESKIENKSGPRDGFYPELGGLITGGGLSVGPGFRHHLFGDRAIVDVSAAMSWKRYSMVRSEIAWPKLMNDRLAVGAQFKYQDFTRINFFGIGSGSLEGQQTDYRLKDVDALGFATVRPNSWLSVTGRAGVLRRLDIERGTSMLVPSIEELFDETSAPSLSRQPNYLHADIALNADSRDVPGYPTRGGRYRMSVAAFHDQNFTSYSFRRIEAEAAQYVPIRRSVVALRARLDLSQTGDGQAVPFYLLPSLGGPNSLRGYADYRFRDRDALMLNAEYRWPLFRAVDGAVFYDTGGVAPSASGLTRHLRSDYGFGVRVHSASHMVARLDLARSREGARAIFTFTAPLSFAKASVVPFVP